MNIPLLNLKLQYNNIKEEIDSAVKRIVSDQNFILGEDVRLCEKEIAAYCNTKYAVGVASGTDALILSLRALGIKEGDEVITSPFTFFATAEAVSIVGAKPVFADIDPETYNINPALIEAKINKKTKAVIAVHLYGQCADMDPIIKVARKHGIKVIEDAAQAIGATYKGRKSGSMGDMGALSFFPSKNLGAFGDAGMVVTNDEKLAELVRTLRVHGSSIRYVHSMIGMNSRLDNLQAAVLRIKLRHLDKWLAARREIAEYYNEKLKGLPFIQPHVPDYNIHTYHLYTLRSKADLSRLTEFLVGAGIETRTYYPIPLHLQECYKTLGYKEGDLPESENSAKEAFSLPIFPELTSWEKEYIISKLKEWAEKKK